MVNSEVMEDMEASKQVKMHVEVPNSNSNSNPEQVNITNADNANNLGICKNSAKLEVEQGPHDWQKWQTLP